LGDGRFGYAEVLGGIGLTVPGVEELLEGAGVNLRRGHRLSKASGT
jgi:hypothetical protein